MKSKEKRHDLTVGVVLAGVILFILSLLLTSCETTHELHQRKLNKAKTKIDKLVNKYPELKSLSDTTYTHHDTIVNTNTHYINDSIFIKGGTRIDTVVQVNDMDSIFNVLSDNIQLRLDKMTGGQVRATVTQIPYYIYETDTVHTVDTVIREKIVKETTNIINTEKSFWWSLWFQVKGWLWLILVVVAVILILRLVFKFVG